MKIDNFIKHTYIHTSMKTHMSFSLDTDVAEELKKEKNQSDLINSYLRHYFGLGNINQTEEQIKQKALNDQIQKDMESAF